MPADFSFRAAANSGSRSHLQPIVLLALPCPVFHHSDRLTAASCFGGPCMAAVPPQPRPSGFSAIHKRHASMLAVHLLPLLTMSRPAAPHCSGRIALLVSACLPSLAVCPFFPPAHTAPPDGGMQQGPAHPLTIPCRLHHLQAHPYASLTHPVPLGLTPVQNEIFRHPTPVYCKQHHALRSQPPVSASRGSESRQLLYTQDADAGNATVT